MGGGQISQGRPARQGGLGKVSSANLNSDWAHIEIKYKESINPQIAFKINLMDKMYPQY